MRRLLNVFSRAVLVLSVAALVQAQETIEKSRGFRPDLVYQLNGIDTVSLFNGNLNLAIPLGPSYPVDAGLSYSFTLRYTGNLWQVREEKCFKKQPELPCEWFYTLNRDNAGMGWSLSLGTLRAASPTAAAGTASSMWSYRSPDGAEHLFFDTLHEPRCPSGGGTNCETAVPGIGYTRDGSYLRLRTDDFGYKIVEFPDGQRQRFEPDQGSTWRLQYMYNAHSILESGEPVTSWVRFNYVYGADGFLSRWDIEDVHARTHTVRFRSADTSDLVATPFVVVDEVELAGFDGGRSVYPFEYGVDGVVDSYNTVSRPTDSRSDTLVKLWFLKSVTTPASESFTFDYHTPTVKDDFSGVLEQMVLPTGGKVDWTYQHYLFSGASSSGAVVGIDERVLSDTAGMELERSKYTLGTDMRTVEKLVPNGNGGHRTELKTEHFFQTAQGPYFGLPFTDAVNDGTPTARKLSTRTYTCSTTACAEEQSSYVKYDLDFVQIGGTACLDGYPCFRDRNRRVISERTTFATDSNRYADTDYEQFDGLGHYRRTLTSGNYTRTTPRATFTNYNPAVGVFGNTASGGQLAGFVMLSPTAPWILNTFTDAGVTEGALRVATTACFDPATGFLLRQRTHENRTATIQPAASDLLRVFTRKSGSGLVASEEWFGGDRNSLGSGNPCSESVARDASSYRVDHTYQHGAVLSSRQSDGTGAQVPYFAVRNDIDQNTGFMKASYDSAGLKTEYTYDIAFRLTKMAPPGVAATEYAYVLANGAAGAEVHVVTGGTAANRLETRYQFDALGRSRREQRLMPGGIWSVSETRYDNAGRKNYQSEAGAGQPSTSHTSWSEFDGLGRARKITASDGSIVRFVYAGNRLSTRKQTIHTPTGHDEVWTIEEADRFGRLIKVTENGDETPTVTEYWYEPGGKLSEVQMGAQQRFFHYGGRGLLNSEVHPESGTTTYDYDARGQIVQKVTPTVTLNYSYDPAGRPKSVDAGTARIKSYTYDRPSEGTDHSMGKLATATRYNRDTLLGTIPVIETYTYAGRGGRVSSRTTTVRDQTFHHGYEYDTYGNVLNVAYPKCVLGCGSVEQPERTVQNQYTNGLLSSVTGYASSITYHPSGMVKSVQHLNAGSSTGPLWEQEQYNDIPRPHNIKVTNFCENLVITAQPAGKQVSPGSQAMVSMTASGATTYQWYQRNFMSDDPLPGQTTSTLTAVVTAPSKYFVRVGNGTCTVDSNLVTVTVDGCATPTVQITASQADLKPAETMYVEAPSIAGASYSWSATNATVAASTIGPHRVILEGACASATPVNVVVSLVVTTSCGEQITASKTLPLIVPQATVSGSTTVAPGGSATIRVAFNVTPQTYRWSDEAEVRTANTSVVERLIPTTTTTPTTTYTLAFAKYGTCDSIVDGSATVTVEPVPAATFVSATAISQTQVRVEWGYDAVADGFVIERMGASGNVEIDVDSSPYIDDVPPWQVFAYRVRAKRGTSLSAWKADFATTWLFQNDPLLSHSVTVSAAHIYELRELINDLRTYVNLPTYNFQDLVLVGIRPHRLHVAELRIALRQARTQVGIATPTYTDTPLTTSTPFRAIHINEVRGGLK